MEQLWCRLHIMIALDSPILGFDLETTGTDCLYDLPVQIALILDDPQEELKSEVFYVNPEIPITPGALRVHGITQDIVQEYGKHLKESAELLNRQILEAEENGIPIAIMNANFDATIAVQMFRRYGLDIPTWKTVMDPLVLDRQFDQKRRGKRKLVDLCSHYGVELLDAHDAGSDAKAAIDLVRVMYKAYPELASYTFDLLFKLQKEAHRAWAESYSNYLKAQGKRGLSDADLSWPLRESG
jgi:DNA polymerase-3 subunit epsilon